jgi:hypothetical protein
MKRNISKIVSLFVLITLMGQLIVSSINVVSSDEISEESSEIGLEDMFDKEVDLENCFFSDSFLIFQKLGEISVSRSVFHYQFNKYHLVDISISVPPPQEVV